MIFLNCALSRMYFWFTRFLVFCLLCSMYMYTGVLHAFRQLCFYFFLYCSRWINHPINEVKYQTSELIFLKSLMRNSKLPLYYLPAKNMIIVVDSIIKQYQPSKQSNKLEIKKKHLDSIILNEMHSTYFNETPNCSLFTTLNVTVNSKMKKPSKVHQNKW